MVRPFKIAATEMTEDKGSGDLPKEDTVTTVDIQENGTTKPSSNHFPVLSHWKKKSCARICCEICYVVLGLVTLIISIAEIIVTILASVANKLYDAEQSGHMVAMLVLAVTGAITLSVVIYSMVGVCRIHTKPLYMTAFLLAVIALIQALLTGLVVNVSDADHFIITKSLIESFKLAQEGNLKHRGLWASTQNDLKCCGLYGAEDYRGPNQPPYFPPNVPISCCPSYDSNKPVYAQEKERQICKARRDYYENGCKSSVVEVFNNSTLAVVIITSMLIVFELLQAIFAAKLSSRKKRQQKENEDAKSKDSTEPKL